MAASGRRRFWIIAFFVLLSAVAWQWNRQRTIPFGRALSPGYWVRHWRGLDRYDLQTGLLESGDPGRREVALTIDDGPDPRYGPAILKILQDKHIPATFFLVGTRVKQNPELTRQIDAGGFEIGNHTYDHQRLDALKPHEIANELRLCDRNIQQATGKRTTLMRPPGVQYNDKVLNVAKALGYVTVSWTVGARDYEAQTPEFIAERVLDHTGPGGIILLHQDTQATAAALPQIIDGLRARGYTFVTVSQMLEHLSYPQTAPPRLLTKVKTRG